MIEALLKTGRYKFVCLGGAIKHNDYRPVKVEGYGDDWIIHPIDGYGNQEMIRGVLQKEKPNAIWFMTDPRFYEWLWEIENEVRANVPMLYYHVWDNLPAPHFNGKYYRSNDKVVCISKVTHKILQTVAPNVESCYLPHAVHSNIFRPATTPAETEQVKEVRKAIDDRSSMNNPKKKIFFWNNRNARRKQSGTIVWWFKEWLDKVGHDKASLLMHTDAQDPHGQDLPHLIQQLEVEDGQILLSTNKVSPEQLADYYRACDYRCRRLRACNLGIFSLWQPYYC